MSVSTTTSPAARAVRCVLLLAAALCAGASRVPAQAADSSGVQRPVYRGQIGLDELAARAVVAGQMMGQPTAVMAGRTLSGAGWPVTVVDTARGMLVTQWLSFSATADNKSQFLSSKKTETANCWMDIRLGVRPVKDGSGNVELIAQLWLQGRFNTDAAMRLARVATEALRTDLLAQAEAGKVERGRLSTLLDYNPPVPSEFTFCGVHKHN